jgi:hypothetical protein
MGGKAGCKPGNLWILGHLYHQNLDYQSQDGNANHVEKDKGKPRGAKVSKTVLIAEKTERNWKIKDEKTQRSDRPGSQALPPALSQLMH